MSPTKANELILAADRIFINDVRATKGRALVHLIRPNATHLMVGNDLNIWTGDHPWAA